MVNDTTSRKLERRSFLRGSALFAAAIGLSLAPGLAEAATSVQPSQQKPKPEGKENKEDKEDKDDKEKPKEEKLIDKEGREYRVCPQCAYNMYKQGRMWVCENCGYSYVE